MSTAEYIPGLTTETIERNLRDRGFLCENYLGKPGPSGLKPSRMCSLVMASDVAPGDTLNIVVTYGATRTLDVLWLRAAVVVPSGKIAGEATTVTKWAREVLGFVATFAYEGADPSRARAWAEENVDNDGAEIVIGKARLSFEARADEALSTLRIDPAT